MENESGGCGFILAALLFIALILYLLWSIAGLF
jgi:hypothetical protein